MGRVWRIGETIYPDPEEQSAMEAINTGRYWTTADCHVL